MLATVKIDLPQELATRLQPVEDQLPRILELGLRELNAVTQPGFAGAADILEFLASLPEPEEIAALRPAKALEDRVRDLLNKNRTVGLTADEQREWEQYEYLAMIIVSAITSCNGFQEGFCRRRWRPFLCWPSRHRDVVQ